MLYLVTTPIGNLEDMSPRAVQALRESDVIACEDTRRTRTLLAHFKIPRPPVFVSYREQNEQRQAERLIEHLRAGQVVAVCTDGGSPAVSDPGYRIVAAAVEAEQALTVMPGPCAVTVALVLSGLPTSSYTFKGYPPRKVGPLRRFLEQEKDLPHTLVLFESPFRTQATLQAALETLGDRRAAVCIELTKKFERVERGHLSELTATLSDAKIKGEVTLVIAGNNPKFSR